MAEEQWKKIPGEGFELELELDYQFWRAWPSVEILKNRLPLSWEAAANKYKDFETENRWEKAEEWEMSQKGQFEHLLDGIKDDFKQRLDGEL